LLFTGWRLNIRLAINAKVKRDGKWKNPNASELVPGDVTRLRLGDIVPADARLLDGDSIEVDQTRTGSQRNERHAPAMRPRK
jgi:magnesium-transporting ATPase (P-type)